MANSGYEKQIQGFLDSTVSKLEKYRYEPPKIPNKAAEELPYDPDDPILTNIQMNYSAMWRARGVEGLRSLLADCAKEENQKSKSASWEHVIKDDKRPYPEMLHLLHAIHPSIIDSILKGDLPSRKFQDPSFATLVLKRARVKPTPGLYLNIICRSGYDPHVQTQASSPGVKQAYEHTGKGLTYNELATLHNKIILYFDAKNRTPAESVAYAKLVDSRFQTSDEYDHEGGERRYYLDPAIYTAFLKSFRVIFRRMNKSTDAEKSAMSKVPMIRCFQEVGWCGCK
jgi:hypothetical protein